MRLSGIEAPKAERIVFAIYNADTVVMPAGAPVFAKIPATAPGREGYDAVTGPSVASAALGTVYFLGLACADIQPSTNGESLVYGFMANARLSKASIVIAAGDRLDPLVNVAGSLTLKKPTGNAVMGLGIYAIAPLAAGGGADTDAPVKVTVFVSGVL